VKKLDLYIIKEHISPFLGGLLVLTFIFLLSRIYQLLDLLIKRGVHFLQVSEVFGLSMAFILAMTVPMSVLIASIVAFGRLGEDFEILAMKSAGIGFRRTLLGPFLISMAVFAVMAAFDNFLLPEANHRLKNLLIDIHHKKPVGEIKPRVFVNFQGYLIYVERKDDRTQRLYGVSIEEPVEGGVRFIFAKEGVVESASEEFIVLRLMDGEIHEALGRKEEAYRRIFFKEHLVHIPVSSELVRKNRKYRSDREMTIGMLIKRAKEVKEEMKNLSRPADKTRKKLLKNRYYSLLVEVHKKFSMPFAAVVFLVLGASLAILSHRGGYETAFGLSFPVFTIYYILLIGGENLSDRGILHPALSMWLPNLMFLLLSVLLVRKCEG